MLGTYEGKGSVAQVVAKQLLDIAQNYGGIDELYPVVFRTLVGREVEEQFLEPVVHVILQFHFFLEQGFQGVFVDDFSVCRELLVDVFGSVVEDASEFGRVDFGAYFFGGCQSCYVLIIEFQRTVQIAVQG